MTVEELKHVVLEEIDRQRDQIISLATSIWKEPEEGFREYKTARKIEHVLQELGLPYEKELALTGVKGYLRGGKEGPTVAILGELDAVCNPEHPAADPKTGMAHACGHASQLAWMLGAGFGLQKVRDALAGSVVLFAVPAEEFLNLSFRQDLKDQGRISYFGGKQELIKLGAFDDIDLAIMGHACTEDAGKAVFVPYSSNGFLGKTARFIGKTAHAGADPDKGINALNACQLALSAIHAQRETFRDDDRVRVHPVITKGGEGVNNVPSDVRTEMYVRARTVEAIRDSNRKVDRALKAGALGIGATVEIVNTPGYLPLTQDQMLNDLWQRSAAALIGSENVHPMGHFGASTDMGDLTHLLPGIHPFFAGFEGRLHGSDFQPVDEEMAYILPAKMFALTVIDLLTGDARAARQIMQNFTPTLSKEEYLDLLDSFSYRLRWSEEQSGPF